LRPQIPESTNLLTVERQVQPDAKTRPSLFLYRVLPVAVCVLAIAGLGVFAFINLGGEDFHFYWDAVIVALLCGVLGGSAVWLVHGALHTAEPTTTVQLVHEVGMGFIVSCVTILAIEITLHVHHSRELKKTNQEHTNAIDQTNKKYTEAIDKANKEHTGAIDRANGDHIAAINKQVEIGRALRLVLDDFAHPPKTLEDAKIGLDATVELENKLPHQQLPRWKTMQLDHYGRLLLKAGQYKEAEEKFKEALCIDEKLADGDLNNLRFQLNVVVTFGRLAEVMQKQNKTDDAVAWQAKAVKRVTNVQNRFPKEEEVRRKAVFARRALGKLRHKEINVGETAEVVLDEAERAYYKVKFAAENKYRIELLAKVKGLDPYLFLLDAAWEVVAADDDGGGFPNARIEYFARRGGEYWIEATTAPESVSVEGYREKQGKVTLKVEKADK